MREKRALEKGEERSRGLAVIDRRGDRNRVRRREFLRQFVARVVRKDAAMRRFRAARAAGDAPADGAGPNPEVLDREVFLSLWIILFALLGAYFIGWLRFPHDEDEYDEMGEIVQHHRTSVTRFFLALVSLAFALYMVPGLWGAPCKAVSAFAPPMKTQDFVLGQKEALHFENYEEGMAYARQNHKPNCRKMEAAVWTHPEVQQLMDDEFVVISLFVDEKTPLPEVETIEENGEQRKLRTIGDKWSYLQRYKFGANAQPFYVLVDNDGRPLTGSYTYNEDVPAYLQWLRDGLKNYK